MVYVIRKSWVDETTEYGRCNDVDVAISICPSGYTVYNEEGDIVHTTVTEDKYKFGKSWLELKTTIEKEIADHKEKNLFSFNPYDRVKKYIRIMKDILILMNKIEVDDSKSPDYEAMWKALREDTEKDLNYHRCGAMQSVAESIQGERKCNEFLDKMKRLENEVVKNE